MNSREIIKKLKNDGWVLYHVKGDHHQFKHPERQGKCNGQQKPDTV
ncbi:type II toxin-antitoxin system HicA family toxin [Bathymodiolus japonicus methanotrophic gill symbiont]